MNSRVILVSLSIIIVVIAGYFTYFYLITTDKITNLNSQITNLNLQIQNLNENITLKNQQIAKLDEDFKLVKFACLFDTGCKDFYNEKLRAKFLESKGLTSAKYETVFTGLNYYKYFIEPTGVTVQTGFAADFLPLKLKDFMKASCPPEIYNIPGKLFSRYDYTLEGNKQVSIVMDEDTVEILCVWLYGKSNDTYSTV